MKSRGGAELGLVALAFSRSLTLALAVDCFEAQPGTHAVVMADELVLNFSQPAASSSTPARSRPAARSKAHGGRWTDRAKERKRSQIEARKASRGGGAQPNAGAQHAQATKRSREGAGADDAGGGAAAPAAKRERTAGGGTGAPGGKRRLDMTVGPYGKKQYISSLFTAEGLPSTADSSNTSSTPIVPARPSNAPLTSVPSTQNEGDAAADEGQADEGPDRAPELSKLGLMRELVAGLAGKLGITGPTACQAGAIPRLIPQSQVKKGKGKGRAPASDFAHDAILRAQTGSGKTLTFLLPMLQDLLTLPPSLLPPSSSAPSSSSGPDRSIGTLALILAPTRELASQIHTVLSSLLSSLPSSSPNPNRPFTISPRALTAGLLVGGANRTHEKRRLRKGCPIVVATPGRLLDHLKTTEAFRLAGEPPRVKDGAPKGRPGNANATALGVRGGGAGAGAGSGKVGLRWLIVDECDRLMDLGFEEQMKGILEELARRSPSSASSSPAYGALSTRRRTILCSATASEGVDRLAGMAISDEDDGKGMVVVGAREDVKVREPERKDLTAPASVAGTKRGSEAVEDGADEDRAEDDEDEADEEDETVKAESAALALPSGFTPPSQLQHNYIIVPPKLRFVTLVALLRKLLVRASSANGGRGMKVLVFMSCTDAVDFWWKALGKMKMGTSSTDDADDEDEDAEEDDKAESSRLVSLHPLISGTPIYRLHGSLPLQTRLASLSAFSSPYTIEDGKRKGSQTDAGVLLCTSVAARGLDVKNVGCVVQVDAPTEVRLAILPASVERD